ncbi:heterokaryon incompatibility protein-domain-containing protein [Pyrenochaeta sp. MPI-SDFR-AT-0127]|nr:heterokaryon incompatibility protein-domain-containing protein [Pyrenochaeta sp. MPI-SDFR-AT-0127]
MSDDLFRHAPLDYEKASLRLIEILRNLSHDGLIRCRMVHMTNIPEQSTRTDSEDSSRGVEAKHKYACVSYTWGKTDGGFKIRINEKTFRVRANLFHFFQTAWKKAYFSRYFWIDALCIDQSNVIERNHQVQQMGQIFSNAEEVLMWLGRKPELESTLRQLNKPSQDDYRLEDSRNNLGIGDLKPNFMFDSLRSSSPRVKSLELAGPYGTFCNDEYWSRAWITQEIVLAKRAFVLVGSQVIDLRILTQQVTMPDTPFYYIADFVNERMKARQSGRSNLASNWGVVNLLHHFRGRECFEPRDRIYSLLALCNDGNDLTVAYDVSNEQVLRQTLSAWKDCLCLCSASIVAQALWPLKFDYPSRLESTKPLIQVKIAVTQIKSMLGGRSLSGTCRFCDCQGVFSEWIDTEGFVLCLNTACFDIQGHLFWQRRWTEDENDSKLGNLYIETWRAGEHSWLPVRDEVFGVETTMIAGIRYSGLRNVPAIILQLTIGTLVDIVQNGFTTKSLISRRCANLWRNVRDSTRRDPRRGLVKLVKSRSRGS